MNFIDRQGEMRRLRRLAERGQAALAVVWGRRRLGKSRLLTEWCKQVKGTYWVADESAPSIQRQYLAEELRAVFPGFAEVSYPDWSALLDRLASDARRVNWRGPLVLDEFPYLLAGAPELPSILQKWVDREKREGGIVLALSGSSQRMMMDSALNADAPLYGRADEMLKLEPLPPGYTSQATGLSDPQAMLDFYTCWGGVPRYWELAQPYGDRHREALHELVLSPLGVLHDEVDRLLRQEMPSAVPLRPVLDAIGLGAHRPSEIAGRLQTVATSLTRSLKNLQDLGYVDRDIPYGQNAKSSKKALYRLADPFLRLWFMVVAPHRGRLQTATRPARLRVIEQCWPRLRAQAWEQLCRLAVPRLRLFDREWHPAGRYWAGPECEWGIVSTSLEEDATMLGECKSLSRGAEEADVDRIVRALTVRPGVPGIGPEGGRRDYVIFVPVLKAKRRSLPRGVTIVDGRRLFSALVEEEEHGVR
ncbi:MAG: ATP-binding protein [Lentisphaerae bacterium]|nr:ATP-binding protein [Lentisphaerota bacterium]